MYTSTSFSAFQVTGGVSVSLSSAQPDTQQTLNDGEYDIIYSFPRAVIKAEMAVGIIRS